MLTTRAIDRVLASARREWLRILGSWGWLDPGRRWLVKPPGVDAPEIARRAGLLGALRELVSVHRREQAELLHAACALAVTTARTRPGYVVSAAVPDLSAWRARCDEELAAARIDRVAVPTELLACRASLPSRWTAEALVRAAMELEPCAEGRLFVAEVELARGGEDAALEVLQVLWDRGLELHLRARFYDALAAARDLAGEPRRALGILDRADRTDAERRPRAAVRRMVARLALGLRTGSLPHAQRAAAALERLDLGVPAVAEALEAALSALVLRGTPRPGELSRAARAQAQEWRNHGGAALARACRVVL